MKVVIKNSEVEPPFYVFYYTPVSSKLKKMGEKLGYLMHAIKKFMPEGDRWWKDTRDHLEQVYIKLKKANRGILLGPPLINKKTGRMNMITMTKRKSEDIKNPAPAGKTILCKVRYLEDIPE